MVCINLLRERDTERERGDKQLIDSLHLSTDYLHLTKAMGQVALSQLPFQVLMAPASYIFASQPAAPSVASILTAIPQTKMTPFHRLLGRLVIAPLLLGHGTLYLLFFFLQSTPDSSQRLILRRIRDRDVQFGLVALATAVCLVYFLARPISQKRGLLGLWTKNSLKVRKRIFYGLHLLLVAMLAGAAFFHVVYARVYVLEALAGFAINLACCWLPKRRVELR